ncbi:MgtC/SapB family protein [Thermoproteota archaeon]
MEDLLPLTSKILLSALLGGVIGYEREIHRHEAGLRTHILVCMGSCLIMLTSGHVFDIYRDIAVVDPSRIAAGVITGIGFIGAGAIIREGSSIKGLTTAASLWVTSAVGLAVGSEFYGAAVITAAIALVVLLLLRSFGKDLLLGKRRKEAKHGTRE